MSRRINKMDQSSLSKVRTFEREETTYNFGSLKENLRKHGFNLGVSFFLVLWISLCILNNGYFLKEAVVSSIIIATILSLKTANDNVLNNITKSKK